MLKVGLIGVGGISGAHIPAWDAMEDVELCALCDVRPEMMEPYKDSKRCYTSFEELLDKEDLDILDICLPTYLHADFAIAAMERGIHVLCEKPISLKLEDVKRVYAAAEKNNVRFMVAHVLRFWKEFEIFKSLVDNGTYGKVLSGCMSRLNVCPGWSFENWMKDENRSGLVSYDLHIHDLDFLVYVFGDPKDFVLRRCKRPEQDYLNVTYDYDGFFINCEASWYAGCLPFNAGFRFQFEQAVVTFENGELTAYPLEGDPVKLTELKDTDTSVIGLSDLGPYANEIRYFADHVKAGTTPDRVKPEELETVIRLLDSFKK